MNPLTTLNNLGQSARPDVDRRDLFADGGLASPTQEDAAAGAAPNPANLEKTIAHSTDHDAVIATRRSQDHDAKS